MKIVPRKLTAKQEAYKNNRIAGMGVSESYKAAYDVKTMSDNALSKEASKLEHDPRIAPEIEAKRKEATERAIVTIEDVVKGLLIEAKGDGKDTTSSARNAAWKTLSEHTGGFDANKQKVEHSGGIDFTNLTDDQIEKLEQDSKKLVKEINLGPLFLISMPFL